MKGTRKCTAPHCSNKKKASRPFCENCFGRLPRDIKNDLVEGRKVGDGMKVMDALNRARDHLQIKNQERIDKPMGKAELIDVELDVLEERDASWKVTDGTIDTQYNAPRWIFLPKSQVENNGDGTFTMPLWIAQDKGLD